jgi:hypothetical protein
MKAWFKVGGGSLEQYAGFSLLGFDNFGAPFSHLRKAMPKSRKSKDGNGRKGHLLTPHLLTYYF